MFAVVITLGQSGLLRKQSYVSGNNFNIGFYSDIMSLGSNIISNTF